MSTITCISEFRSSSAGRCGCHDSSGSNKCCHGNEDKNLSGVCNRVFKKYVLFFDSFLRFVLLLISPSL